jgi:hypothetical protein
MHVLFAQLLALAPLHQGLGAGERIRLEVSDTPALEVRAFWEDFRSSKYRLFERYPELRGFAPACERREVEAAAFRTLLPAEPVAIGDTWELAAESGLAFLRQLHPGATSELHHEGVAAPGAYGCLAAWSEERALVALRIHAEFVLAEDEQGRKSWLTPAQFAGTLVLDRQRGAVLGFALGLPPRDTNVDVNVPFQEDERTGSYGLADIGFIPRMQLLGGDVALVGLTWQHALPEQEVRRRLARRFYAAAAIDWLPFPEAVTRAKARSLPLFALILFGTLDDESC